MVRSIRRTLIAGLDDSTRDAEASGTPSIERSAARPCAHIDSPEIHIGSGQPQARLRNGSGRGGRHRSAVVVDHPLERRAGPRGDRQVRALGEARQRVDAAEPSRREGMLDELEELNRDRRRNHHSLRVPRQDQVPLESELPLAGRLVRRLLADPLEDVVVQLAERDHAVLVAIGLAGGEALDQRAREDRRLLGDRVGKVRPLERELHRVRRGDNHPTSTPAELGVALLELIRHVERAGRTRDHATLERTAVAAIEEEDDSLRPAPPHQPVDEGRIDRRRGEECRPGICRGKVEFAAVVLEPVAGEVHDDEVVRPTARQHGLDPLADRRARLVVQDLDLELAQVRVAEGLREGVSVGTRCAELAQPGIPIPVGRNDQGNALTPHPGHRRNPRPRRCRQRPRHRPRGRTPR